METGKIKRLGSGALPAVLLLAMLRVSLYLLNSATQDPQRFSEIYPTLLLVSGAELILLIVLIASNLIGLIRQYRSGATGSRLSVRLIFVFVVLAVVPVSVVYHFSLEFLQRGINSWFDVGVESTLESALSLSRAALDQRMREQLRLTQRMAEESLHVSDSLLPFTLDDLRVKSGVAEVTVFSMNGHIVASSGVNPTQIIPSLPHETVLLQVRQGRNYAGIEPMKDGALSIRIVVATPRPDASAEARVMQTLSPITANINELAAKVQSGYKQYQEMAFMREPLKFSFVSTLSLVLLLSLLAAVWGAFYSARHLVAPIRLLAIGTRLVSSGDYGKPLPMTSNDEFGVLVQSFNDMTKRIAQARDEAAKS